MGRGLVKKSCSGKFCLLKQIGGTKSISHHGQVGYDSHHFSAANLFWFSSDASDSSNSIKMIIDFKPEADMEEYLKIIGIQYRFSCLSENNPEGYCVNISFLVF